MGEGTLDLEQQYLNLSFPSGLTFSPLCFSGFYCDSTLSFITLSHRKQPQIFFFLSGPGRVSSLLLRWSSWVLYRFASKTCQDILFLSPLISCVSSGAGGCAFPWSARHLAHAHAPETVTRLASLTYITRAEKLFSRALRRLEGDDIPASGSETVQPCVRSSFIDWRHFSGKHKSWKSRNQREGNETQSTVMNSEGQTHRPRGRWSAGEPRRPQSLTRDHFSRLEIRMILASICQWYFSN